MLSLLEGKLVIWTIISHYYEWFVKQRNLSNSFCWSIWPQGNTLSETSVDSNRKSVLDISQFCSNKRFLPMTQSSILYFYATERVKEKWFLSVLDQLIFQSPKPAESGKVRSSWCKWSSEERQAAPIKCFVATWSILQSDNLAECI